MTLIIQHKLILLGCLLFTFSCSKKEGATKEEQKRVEKKVESMATKPTEQKLQTAQEVLQAFLQPGADFAQLTKQLKPTEEDYLSVFKDEFVEKAKAYYEAMWNNPNAIIAPKMGQTEMKLWSATTEQLQEGQGDANQFPGGYKAIASLFKPGLTFYSFKFVKPTETFGMAFDGLIQLNGRWRIFPKPFRIPR